VYENSILETVVVLGTTTLWYLPEASAFK